MLIAIIRKLKAVALVNRMAIAGSQRVNEDWRKETGRRTRTQGPRAES